MRKLNEGPCRTRLQNLIRCVNFQDPRSASEVPRFSDGSRVIEGMPVRVSRNSKYAISVQSMLS